MQIQGFNIGPTSVIAVVLISIVFLRFLRKKNVSNKRLPPSFPSLPFIGSLPFLGNGERLYHYFMEKADELGDVYTFYAGQRLALVINGRETIRDALVNRSIDFADRSPIWTEEYMFNTELCGITFKHYNDSFKRCHGVISSILGHLSDGKIALTELRINKGIEIAVDEIRKKNEIPFDPKSLFTEISGAIILSILFGDRILNECYSRIHDILASSSSYLDNIDPALDVLPVLRFLPSFRRKFEVMGNAKSNLINCLEKEIKMSLEESSDESFTKKYAELEKSGLGLGHKELVYILRDLVFGGTVTVSTTLLWAVVLLANNQEIQHRLREELRSVIQPEKIPTMEDKLRLPFAEAVMLEILRRKGVTPFSSTHSTIHDTELKGYFVPAGCMVLINLYSAHLNVKDWEDPEVFRPERFLDDVKKKEFLIPFSLGLRSCIGEKIALQEIFLILCNLVQRFYIKPPTGADSINEDEVYKLALSPRPFRVRFIPTKPFD